MTQETQHTPEPAAAEPPLPEAVPPEPGAAAAAAHRAAELEAQVEALQEELAKQKDQLLRAVAETENVRRRLEIQAEERGKYAVTNFAKDVLAVADNLRRAMESLPAEARESDPLAQKLAEGVELTERGLAATLERYAIKRIEAMGQRFDPHLHQAMMEVEDPSRPTGTVVLEMQAGYTIQDRLLRAAMVGVSRGGPKAQPGDGGVDTNA
ncbi:MAG TPA: nucleotide exchange factor GrpE [Rhodospirillaceae bacterium]|nr:nucleotide exchange factor GrpE [Rhodospirillaceae bacterium]